MPYHVVSLTAPAGGVVISDISDAGVVVGSVRDQYNNPHPLAWVPGGGDVINASPLPTMGQPYGEALAINADGQIVGWIGQNWASRTPVKWVNGQPAVLPVAGANVAATGIGDDGTVAVLDFGAKVVTMLKPDGSRFVIAPPTDNAVAVMGGSCDADGAILACWQTSFLGGYVTQVAADGAVKDVLPGVDFSGRIIRDGYVLGSRKAAPPAPVYIRDQVIVTPGRAVVPLQSVPGHSMVMPADLNAGGTVVGFAYLAGPPYYEAATWGPDGAGKVLAAPLLPGEILWQANAISDNGQIVAVAMTPATYSARAVLLIPI